MSDFRGQHSGATLGHKGNILKFYRGNIDN
nr:MAG TPA: hypothetical protein [Caudoviricetes sp.]